MKKNLKNGMLPVLCLVVAFLVSLSYGVTQPVIEQNAQQTALELRQQVLPDAGSFAPVEGSFTAAGVSESSVFRGEDGSAAITVTVKGYGGKLQVMVGVDKNGEVAGVRVLSSSETPGLGKRTEEDSFISQFQGKTGQLTVGEDIDKVAGATISSKAMTTAVNGACEIFKQMGEVQ